MYNAKFPLFHHHHRSAKEHSTENKAFLNRTDIFLGKSLDVPSREVLVGVDPAYLSQTSLYELRQLGRT